MIWDDKTPRCIAELSFRSPVRQVRLRRDIVAVLVDKKVYIYRFSDLTLIGTKADYSPARGQSSVPTTVLHFGRPEDPIFFAENRRSQPARSKDNLSTSFGPETPVGNIVLRLSLLALLYHDLLHLPLLGPN